MTEFETVRVAAVQATPEILDAEASVDKAVRLLGEAAGEGARLVALPELFVPLYQSNAWAKGAARVRGLGRALGAPLGELGRRPRAADRPHREACREHDVVCGIGVNERESERPGSLYNA